MSDQILIRELEADCIIGVFPKERVATQRVLVDLVLDVDTRAAAASDDLADTLDYKDLKDRIVASVEASSFQLIETLAQHVATLCLAEARVERVQVTVDKPGALTGAKSVAISIVRP